jgi:hypothetical protein
MRLARETATKLILVGGDRLGLAAEARTIIPMMSAAKRVNMAVAMVISTNEITSSKRMAAALRRLTATLNNHDLIFTIKADFPIDDGAAAKWCTLLDRIAATDIPNVGGLDLYKRHAVQSAADFLRQHGVWLTSARTGKFCRLAEVFYRPGNAKLYHYCREYLGENPD